MKKNNLETFIRVLLYSIAILFISPPIAIAGVIANTYEALGDYPSDTPIPDWTSNGQGGRASDVIWGERQYTRDDFDVSHQENFLIEAVLSAVAPAAPGIEAGARLRVTFDDPNVPNPFEPNNSMRMVEVRLRQDSEGTNHRLALVDGFSGIIKQTISVEWGSPSPTFRIRLMRQKIEGVYKIIMEVESSDNWEPNGTIRVEEDFSSFSAQQPMAGFTSEFSFGNFIGLATTSVWESIHITVCDDDSTLLPYWPQTPPAPVLSHDNKGFASPQGVDLLADCSSQIYLSNDMITPEIEVDGTTIIGETRVNPQVESWDFDGLGDNQTVLGRVNVMDASGRTKTSSDANVFIPNMGYACKGDFDNDGDVDGSDLSSFTLYFGRNNCP